MDDNQKKAKLVKIDDLQEAVGEFLDNSTCIGDDPYYRDLNDALWDMLERAYNKSKEPK